MPWGLKRLQESRQFHFLTFSCCRRRPNFGNPALGSSFESGRERVRHLSPLRGWLNSCFHPWLAPWALFLRRFAANGGGLVLLRTKGKEFVAVTLFHV